MKRPEADRDVPRGGWKIGMRPCVAKLSRRTVIITAVKAIGSY